MKIIIFSIFLSLQNILRKYSPESS